MMFEKNSGHVLLSWVFIIIAVICVAGYSEGTKKTRFAPVHGLSNNQVPLDKRNIVPPVLKRSVHQRGIPRPSQKVREIFWKKNSGRLSRLYVNWLALQKRRLYSNTKLQGLQGKDANIQSDVPGCRDDLCIANEYDSDYFDGENSVEASTVDPVDVPCPSGYEPVVRKGIIYCDVVRETTMKTMEDVTCKDEQKIISSQGVRCVSVQRSLPVTTTDKPKPTEVSCEPGQELVDKGNGAVCSETLSSPGTPSHDSFIDINTSANTSPHPDHNPSTDYISPQSKTDKTTETMSVYTATVPQIYTSPQSNTGKTTETMSVYTTDMPQIYTSPDSNTDKTTETSVYTANVPQIYTSPQSNNDKTTETMSVYTANVPQIYTNPQSNTDKTTETISVYTANVPQIYTSPQSNTDKTTETMSVYSNTDKTTEIMSVYTANVPQIYTSPDSDFDKTTDLPFVTFSTGSTPAHPTDIPHIKTSQHPSIPKCPEGHQGILTEFGPRCKKITETSEYPTTTTKNCPPGYKPVDGINQDCIPLGEPAKPPAGKTRKPAHTLNGKQPPLFKGTVPSFNKPPNSNIIDGLFGSNQKQNFNSINGKIPVGGKKNFGKFDVGPKLSPCEDGKVLAGTPDGFRCLDPVFPEGVCPEGRVPYMSSMGLQCLPCPFGQHVINVDGGGVKCVSMVTESSSTQAIKSEELDSDLDPCPEGLMPFDTASGRICRYIPPEISNEVINCPKGLTAVMINGQMQCKDHSVECPPGLISIFTETGDKVCGFDTHSQINKCDNAIDGDCSPSKTVKNEDKVPENFCPPGLEPVHLHTGEISCQYIIKDHKITPTVSLMSHCGFLEILTQTASGFVCLPEDNIPDEVKPVCSDGLELAKLGLYYDCITSHEADLVCTGSEVLTRLESGFVCLTNEQGFVHDPCGIDEVMITGLDGLVKCISLQEAKEHCGEGFMVLRYGDGFICKPQSLDVNCPEGFILKLVKGSPVCVSSSEHCGEGFMVLRYGDGFICKPQSLDVNCPEGFILKLVKGSPVCVSASETGCKDLDGSMSTLCLTDLKAPDQFDLDLDADLDTIFEPQSSCGEGQGSTIIDGQSVCVDGGEMESTIPGPCDSDGVRPCDLDLTILLEGCNPDCANGGTCVDGKCVCTPGITGVGCSEDINECLAKETKVCEHKCENIFGSYQCICPEDMIIGSDGHSCEEAGCFPDCLNGGQCVRGTCQCTHGFEGEYCQTDKDECSRHGNRLCQHYCRNTYGGYQCICSPGSRLAQDQRTCINTTCIPECRNGGTCENHKCYCPPGFYGFVCQLDINECYKDKQLCQQDCTNTWGSYKCSCREGYILQSDGHSCT